MTAGLHFQCTTEGVLEAVEEATQSALQAVLKLMAAIGTETVAYLRSLTNEMRPPLRRGENPRKAHPGHWADISGNLARNYRWEIETGHDYVTLVLANDAGYAAELEARDGYWVLKGVAEPGGPVEVALTTVVRRLAPDWEVRRD